MINDLYAYFICIQLMTEVFFMKKLSKLLF